MTADTYRDKQGRTCARLNRGPRRGFYVWRGLAIYLTATGDWAAINDDPDWTAVARAWTLRSMRLALGEMAEKEERGDEDDTRRAGLLEGM